MSLCSTSSAFPQSLNPRRSSTSFVSPCRLSVLSQPLVFKNFSLPSVVVLDARRCHLVSARSLVLCQSSLFKVCLTTPQSLSPIGDTCWHCLVGPRSSVPFQSSHLCYLTLCSSTLLSSVVHVVPSLPHVKDASPTQMYFFLPASWAGDTHKETDVLPIGNREEKEKRLLNCRIDSLGTMQVLVTKYLADESLSKTRELDC